MRCGNVGSVATADGATIEEADPSHTLRDYVLIVGRSWIVIVVTVVIGLATAVDLAFAATPTYTSSAQVRSTGHATTSGQDLAYVGNYVQSRTQTYERLGTRYHPGARVPVLGQRHLGEGAGRPRRDRGRPARHRSHRSS